VKNRSFGDFDLLLYEKGKTIESAVGGWKGG